MFESIVSKIIAAVRNVVRTIRETTAHHPWIAPVAILALFVVW
jgi:hypothetical protein